MLHAGENLLTNPGRRDGKLMNEQAARGPAFGVPLLAIRQGGRQRWRTSKLTHLIQVEASL